MPTADPIIDPITFAKGMLALKMSETRLHIISRGERWALVAEDTDRAIKLHDSIEEATEAAKIYTERGNDVIIHHRDGSVAQWLEGAPSTGVVVNAGAAFERKATEQPAAARPVATKPKSSMH
jgi:gamma-glutamyl phosphate reductase